MADEQKATTGRQAVIEVIRGIAPGHDPEFLLDTSERLVQRGLLGDRATLTAGADGCGELPLFVGVDAWGQPTGCARCGDGYSEADGWGVVTFRRKAGGVGVVLCAKCNEAVTAKEAK